MKKFIKTNTFRFVPFLVLSLVLAIMIFTAVSMAAQATVNLGTTSTYAILAGTTITNTGTTVINGTAGGDVGLYPGSAFTGQGSVTRSGSLHINDAAVITAKTDLVTAYDDAAGRTPVTTIPIELGGTTLTPGVYTSGNGNFEITGNLILDAQGDPEGVFVFLTTTNLNTAEGSNVSLINSARFCRVFWKVGSSATLGVNSHFAGHIFALTSISLNTGASVEGQLLARNGAVTLDSNTISNGLCDVTPTVSVTPTQPVTLGITATPTVGESPNTGDLPGTTPLYLIFLTGGILATITAIRLKSRKQL
ncbi:MAG: ice-binding family protein [Saccharofermentanales bacterium]